MIYDNIRFDQKSFDDSVNAAIPSDWTRRFPVYLKFVVKLGGKEIEVKINEMRADHGAEVTVILK